jgi:hypothetical protein
MYTSTELFKAEASYRREHLRDIYRPTSAADREAHRHRHHFPALRFRRGHGPITRVDVRPVNC